MVERMLLDFGTAHALKSVSLRYFNAAGADPDCEIGERHDPETHLIPLVLDVACGKRINVQVFGTDYDTPDGTCIRDYIHVTDLAAAHLAALRYVLADGESDVFNLGNGTGFSVREIISTAARATGEPIPHVDVARRGGDPSMLVGSAEKAKAVLGWEPRYDDLEEIVRTAWNWHRSIGRNDAR
jgi:UDP-glucose 4-epimerase